MSNNQATIEDLIDEMYDLLDKGWKMPLSAGKMFVDGEEVRQILDEIKEEIPSEVRKAKAIVADRPRFLTRPSVRRKPSSAWPRKRPRPWSTRMKLSARPSKRPTS